MSEMTIEKLMERMPKAFLPDKAVGVDAVINFDLSGETGGEWAATIREGNCTVIKGLAPDPTLTLSTDADTYLGIFTGGTNAMQAFMQGKIKLKGDLNLAMKLTNFFKMR